MKKGFVFLSLCIGLIFFIGDVSQIFAQETSSTEFTLEEIVVTAQKRAENQQKVPIAMDVISDKDLAAEGKTNVDDILFGLSNVAINQQSDGMRITIRGLSDNGDLVDGGVKTSAPMVAVNIDGAFNNMSSAGQNLFDVERVEVLYGPQSTMYSSNAPGGIVNVVTAAPKTDKFSASASYNYGSYQLSNAQFALNAPILSDKLAMRLSGTKSRQGTYVEGSSISKSESVRLKTLWNANDKLAITLTGTLSKAGSGGMMGGSVLPFVHQSDKYYPDGTPLTDPWTSSGNDFGQGANTNNQITKGANLNVTWDTFLGALTVTPNYSKSTAEGDQTGSYTSGRGTPNEITYTDSWHENNTNIQKGLEVRMASSKDFTLFTWIAGGTYFKYTMQRTNKYVNPGSTDEWSDVLQSKKAVFANVTYPFWFYNKLSAIVGYRQSWDDSTKSGNMGGGPGGGGAVGMTVKGRPDYKYGLQYDMSDNMMMYANYTSSYRTDAMGQFGNKVRPVETNKSYTLGAKTRMFDNKIQLNVAAYYYDYKNMYANNGMKRGSYTRAQITENEKYPELMDNVDVGRSSVGTDGLTYYEIDADPNGWGDMTSKGLDTSISWVVSAKDMVNLSVSYLDSKWKHLFFESTYFTIWPSQSYDSVTQTNSPKWSMTASYEHNFELGSYGTLTPHIDVQHKTSFNLCFDTGPLENGDPDPGYYYQEPYNLWNASLSFQHSSGKWSLNALVKNATNYAVKRSYDKSGTATMMLGDPRTYGATLSIKF